MVFHLMQFSLFVVCECIFINFLCEKKNDYAEIKIMMAFNLKIVTFSAMIKCKSDYLPAVMVCACLPACALFQLNSVHGKCENAGDRLHCMTINARLKWLKAHLAEKIVTINGGDVWDVLISKCDSNGILTTHFKRKPKRIIFEYIVKKCPFVQALMVFHTWDDRETERITFGFIVEECVVYCVDSRPIVCFCGRYIFFSSILFGSDVNATKCLAVFWLCAHSNRNNATRSYLRFTYKLNIRPLPKPEPIRK